MNNKGVRQTGEGLQVIRQGGIYIFSIHDF